MRFDTCKRGVISQKPCLVASVPSIEESNEVAKELAENEVFGDVKVDELLVIEDEMEVVLSKAPKSLSDADSELLVCAGCPVQLCCDVVLVIMLILSGWGVGSAIVLFLW